MAGYSKDGEGACAMGMSSPRGSSLLRTTHCEWETTGGQGREWDVDRAVLLGGSGARRALSILSRTVRRQIYELSNQQVLVLVDGPRTTFESLCSRKHWFCAPACDTTEPENGLGWLPVRPIIESTIQGRPVQSRCGEGPKCRRCWLMDGARSSSGEGRDHVCQ